MRYSVKAVRYSEKAKARMDPTYVPQEHHVCYIEEKDQDAADWKVAYGMASLLYPPYSRAVEAPEPPKEEK